MQHKLTAILIAAGLASCSHAEPPQPISLAPNEWVIMDARADPDESPNAAQERLTQLGQAHCQGIARQAVVEQSDPPTRYRGARVVYTCGAAAPTSPSAAATAEDAN